MKPNINGLKSPFIAIAVKTLFVIILVAGLSGPRLFAQTTSDQAPRLLTSYYGIKDALVAGDANTAAAKAEEFVKAANAIDEKTIPAPTRSALVKDAGDIAGNKDIKQQREHFAGLSTNMATLAKSVKLSSQPVYQQYCPMKKSYWLSADKAIKNPYYGNAMLTCGKVVETIQ
ncbi:MAG TPA: DUF3347 domain-containing protein [Chitinophagaceae bacterium]|nr:DUF3347 domain-containing protein [Chitinophagaceae bacterium]